MKRRTKKTTAKLKDLTHDAAPASVGLVKEVRDELRAEIRGVEHGLKSQIAGMDSKFEDLSSKFETVITSVHRTQVLMEEQRGENRIVLDGLKTVLERQNRCKKDIGDIKLRIGL